MTTTFLNVSGIDPIVARDGRPFGDGTGNRMRGLPWPLPSAVAGSARRACVLNQPSGEFDPETIQKLLNIEVSGLFPVLSGKLYLPAPKDCVWDGTAIHRVQPQTIGSDGSGCDMPNGLRPVTLNTEPSTAEFKPERLPAWWSINRYAEWLTGNGNNWKPETFNRSDFLAAAETNTRDRLTIAADSGAAEESKLFTVSDLTISHLRVFGSSEPHQPCRPQLIDLSLRVSSSDLTQSIQLLHPLGGNRRLAHWANAAKPPCGWSCPDNVREQLKSTKQVCLVLATPAIFDQGWLPGWLGSERKGTPPGSSVTLQLVGVVNERWKALARFGLDPKNLGPQPLRRMVPAGSVYFFEVLSGDAAPLANCWLQSVCDDEQERRDGFGLAIWGIW
ncbi:MAG: type III-B CRISPR module-associated protein Cmr3 [Bacteroidales bacterium]|nr:type III-B CRISPR module-associated protein Cmr3 [Bacteroidales bacterium]